MYVVIWGLILFIAISPNIFFFNDCSSLSFLNGKDIDTLMGQSYLYSLIMIIVLHFAEVAYLLSTKDLDKEQFRNMGVINSVFMVLVILFIIIMIAHHLMSLRKICFILFWLSVIGMKFATILWTSKKTIPLNKTS